MHTLHTTDDKNVQTAEKFTEITSYTKKQTNLFFGLQVIFIYCTNGSYVSVNNIFIREKILKYVSMSIGNLLSRNIVGIATVLFKLG